MSELIISHCAACGRTFSACPQCVNTIQIDPATGYPPDVRIVGGVPVNNIPDPEAVARSEARPVCDGCIQRRNRMTGERVATAEERHARSHF